MVHPLPQTETVLYVTFFLVWVSNVKLEIWTLDPLRKFDPNPAVTPTLNEAYTYLIPPIQRHLNLHSVGLISVFMIKLGL